MSGPSFDVAGWAIDRGSSVDSGVDAVHVYAFPLEGGRYGPAIWVGADFATTPRPDVSAVFGVQFINCGFKVGASLPAGTYDIAVYVHSSVTRAFNPPRLVRIVIP